MKLSEIYQLINDGKIDEAIEELVILNYEYRQGTPLISDPDYDKLYNTLKQLKPNHPVFSSGVIESVDEVDPDRKEKLKYPMFSLDKETSVEDIHKWLRNKGIPLSVLLVVTAKYDGISILKNEKTGLAWSRGDGVFGETLHEHYKRIGGKNSETEFFSIGELIIPKPIFCSKIWFRDNGEPFKNARNMIAGLKNSDTISNIGLTAATHIRYGLANEDYTMNKSEQLEFLAKELHSVPYKILRANELNADDLEKLFFEWGKEYDIDGLVIDIDDKNIRKRLGRERNNNPAYSRAYKSPSFAENADTKILSIEYNISKLSYLKPVAIITPVELNGVTVSRVTLNNGLYVKTNGLGRGSKIRIQRSGMVIPKIIKVLESTGFEMPTVEGSEVIWNESGVELMLKDSNNETVIKQIISFFEILDTENVSDGVVRQLFNAGYISVKEILNLTQSDFEKLEGFGKRKAEIIFSSIKKATTNVDLSKLQHASNIFYNLGSKKLELLVHFKEKPSFSDIIKIEGFSDISAKSYLEGYDKFWIWFESIKSQVTIAKKAEVVKSGDDLKDMSFCFTGIRRSDLEAVIESRSGKIATGVSKNTTHLICKDKSSSSSKMQKAYELGLEVFSVEELEEFLKDPALFISSRKFGL